MNIFKISLATSTHPQSSSSPQEAFIPTKLKDISPVMCVNTEKYQARFQNTMEKGVCQYLKTHRCFEFSEELFLKSTNLPA